MDTTAVIGGLVAAIVAMATVFGYLIKDERRRVEDLLKRLSEQQQVVFTTVDVLSKAVEVVKGQMQLYEAISKLTEAKDALGSQKQLYEAIAAVQKAAQLFEKNARSGKGAGDDR